jgi:mannitol/fructose-specific phosphotransferase system IIA component
MKIEKDENIKKDFRNNDEAIEYIIQQLRKSGLIVNDEIDKKTVDKFISYIDKSNE